MTGTASDLDYFDLEGGVRRMLDQAASRPVRRESPLPAATVVDHGGSGRGAAQLASVDQMLLERQRRLTPVSMRGEAFLLRRAAEHEAAHVVAAQALGLAVREAVVYADGTGATEFTGGTLDDQRIVWTAGDLWISELADGYLCDGYTRSCTDSAWRAVQMSNRDTIDRVSAACRRLLRSERQRVLDVADQLFEQRTIRWS